jgi:hypothetical protein
MVAEFQGAAEVTKRKSIKLVREGKFAAEVPVELIEDAGGWSPYLSANDARKLDDVRQMLRSGDLAGASRLAHVFELMPVSV